MRKLVIYLKKKIKAGKHKRAIHYALRSGLIFARATHFARMETFMIEGHALAAARDDNYVAFEDALVSLVKKRPPSFTLVSYYLLHCIRSGKALRVQEILKSGLPEEYQALIKAAVLRSEGRLDEALAALSVPSDDFRIRHQIALEKRGLFHQMQDHEALATHLVEFLESEPNVVLSGLATSAAGSAETAHREDLFRKAVSRIVDDLERVQASPILFKKHWKDAFTAALTLFDPRQALEIAQKAQSQRYNAKKSLDQAEAVCASLAPVMHAIEAARQDIMERAGKIATMSRAADVAVVFPAAALRSNGLDYPGFREDIRTVFKTIIETLDQDGIVYSVKSRIRTHGTLDLDIPFFSYHTVSDGRRGLHIKETDRRSLFSFDTRGYAGWSAFSNLAVADLAQVDLGLAEKFFDRDCRQAMESRLSKYQQAEVREELPANFIFVGLQVIGDAVQSLAYRSPFEMVDEVIETARRHDLKTVVKRHPACKSAEVAKYLQAKQDSGEIQVAAGNIHDIIQAATAVCVVNSGVGAEALLYEKPVYLFGRADYMSACFVCKESGDFDRQFAPDVKKLSRADFRKFWYLYRTSYACDLTDPEKARDWIARRVRAHLADQLALPRP